MSLRWLTIDELAERSGGDERLRQPLRHLDRAAQDRALESALAAAESTASAYLSIRYRPEQLPGSPTEAPALLKSLLVLLALYEIESDLGAPSEHRRERFDEARRTLRDVAAGRAALGLEGAPAVDRAAPPLRRLGRGARFDRETLQRMLLGTGRP